MKRRNALKERTMKNRYITNRRAQPLFLILMVSLIAFAALRSIAQTSQAAPANPKPAEQVKPANPGQPDQAAPAVPSQPEQPKPPVAQVDQTKPVHIRYQQGIGLGMVSPQETYWSLSKWCKVEYDDAGKFHSQTFFDGKCLFEYSVNGTEVSKDCGKAAADQSKPEKVNPFIIDPKALGESTGDVKRILGIECEVFKKPTAPGKMRETCWSQVDGLVVQSMDFCSGKPCGMTLLNKVHNITPAELQKSCWENFANKKVMTK
jgi:hypothetical protein